MNVDRIRLGRSVLASWRVVRESGLSRHEATALLVLACTELTVTGAVARAVGISGAQMSRVVTNLLEAGYINSTPKPGDRRLSLLTLTEEGLGQVDEILAKLEELLC